MKVISPFFALLAVLAIILSVIVASSSSSSVVVSAADDGLAAAVGAANKKKSSASAGADDDAKDAKDVAKAKEAMTKKIMRRPGRRSLFAACRSEITQFECLSAKKKADGTAAGRREALKSTIECLDQKSDKMKDSGSCKHWLTARAKCAADTKAVDDICPAVQKELAAASAAGETNNDLGQANWMDDVTRCLMHADIEKLSKECRESEYFRALSFQRMWRARRDKNIRLNNKMVKPPADAAPQGESQ